MLVFDELKKNEPQLRLVAVMLVVGLCILLVGLWWVQVVSSREYQTNLESQSFRTVRLPAARGKIYDRDGRILVENRPSYNLSIYFDDLSSQFKSEYRQLRPVNVVTNDAPFWAFWDGSKVVRTNRAKLNRTQIGALEERARYEVVNGIVSRISDAVGEHLTLGMDELNSYYLKRRPLPFPILKDLNPTQLARYEEHYSSDMSAELELEPVRYYPYGITASHLLGYVRHDDQSHEGEEASFSYRLPDYRGVVGIEGGYDAQLRGHAGVESVLVNNVGYRQSENVWDPPVPGENVILTIDLDLQQAAEASLLKHQGPNARGAIVVVDARDGDILAMVSEPSVDPNCFISGFTHEQLEALKDPTALPQINRATQQNYAPGSIFKPVVALACLEHGLNPNMLVDNPGYKYVGRRKIHDLAAPGEYNLKKAIMHSSNTYFVTVGLDAGIDAIIQMAQQFHFGERTGIRTWQETSGILPSLNQVHHGWTDGNTANLCIGQGQLSVTPLQMAMAYAAIANGGTLFWPRLVARIEPQGPDGAGQVTKYPTAMVRNHIKINPHNMQILHDAMLAETKEGTGQASQVAGLQICGKTGTAQVMDQHNHETGVTTWFASFAPYEKPRYAVIVMVEGGTYGGTTCAPIAHDVYEEILRMENKGSANTVALGMR